MSGVTFQSVVYSAGKLDFNKSPPVDRSVQSKQRWQVDGFKVEGLAPTALSGSKLSFATDDEEYGGVWRPLFDAP